MAISSWTNLPDRRSWWLMARPAEPPPTTTTLCPGPVELTGDAVANLRDAVRTLEVAVTEAVSARRFWIIAAILILKVIFVLLLLKRSKDLSQNPVLSLGTEGGVSAGRILFLSISSSVVGARLDDPPKRPSFYWLVLGGQQHLTGLRKILSQ